MDDVSTSAAAGRVYASRGRRGADRVAGQRRRRWWRSWLAMLAAVGLGTAGSLAGPSPAEAGTPVPVVVTITEITQIGTDVDPGPTQGPVGDFYAGVTINGTTLDNFADRYEFGLEIGVGYIFPYTLTPTANWSFAGTGDSDAGTATVSIELWDNDDCDHPFCDDTGIFENNDDQVDISPTGSETLSLTVSLADGKWSGDAAWPQSCVQGTGGEAVKICFEVSTVSGSADTDGDGLLDGWEQHGYNADGDSTTDVNLPALGANPQRKDLFVEVDCLVSDGNNDGDLADIGDHSHCPQRNAMQDVVTAFANAPVGNVDGSTGVQLHLDLGPLYGVGAVTPVAATGGVTGNVGDFGGGGSQIPEAGNQIIDYDGAAGNPGSNYFTLKSANFNPVRAPIFRYAIAGHQTNSRAAVNDCTSGKADGIPGNDFYVTLGGGRDLDGNGTVDTGCWTMTAANGIDDDGDGRVDEDPQNGIDDDGSCAAGTDTNGDGVVCGGGDVGVDEDGGFSVGSRAEMAGTLMHELGHTIGLQHGGGESTNNNKPNYLSVMNYSFQACSVPTSPTAGVVPGGCDYSRNNVGLTETSLDECFGVGQGFGSTDWDGDTSLEGVTNCQPPNTANVGADINGDGNRTALPGFDDWQNLAYQFRGLAVAADGVSQPVPDEPDPTVVEQSRRRLSGLMAPGLDVTVTGPATALPGALLTYTVSTVNNGRGPALVSKLTITRPDGSSSGPLDLGALLVGAAPAVRTVDHQVPANACPQTLTTTARVDYLDFASIPGSADGSAATTVLDVTPPKVTVSLSPTSLSPPNHKLRAITATVKAIDECDPNPAVKLLSIASSEADNGLGDGDTPGDVVGAATGTDDRSFELRSERSGTGPGRTYTVVYEATDASGNAATATATVVVRH